ncbi:hypothetical protein [Effusibacillus dendaii]|uniref:hypothetical protein n=1 Tax=Effusibacillus dendaii TaxID=2743772 RepID=UPI001909B70D|nr:hypothetical protein [Effusibacillus dendaii]
MQEGLFGPALGPLCRCVELAPEAPAANYEFAYVLMKEFYHEEALQFFAKAFELEQAPSIAFYMAQLLMFLGRLQEAEAVVHKFAELVNEASGEGRLQLVYLSQMLQRLQTYGADTIRDWHFVQYGNILLRLFEEDHPNEPNDSEGRYTFVNFDYQQVANVLVGLQTLIEQISVFPKYQYVAAAGAGSEPLAHALAALLRLPVRSFAEMVKSGKNGIVIASFNDEVVEIAADVWERKELLFCSFAFSWTVEINIVPDAIGYLAQSARLPWQERAEFDANGQPFRAESDPRSAEQIAGEILRLVPTVDQVWLHRLKQYCQKRTEHLMIGERMEVPRKKFFVHTALGGTRY